MGYCTIQDIENIIAQALTSATTNSLDPATPGDLLTIGKSLDTNLVTEAIVNSYILYADTEINATLSALYKVPLEQKIDLETVLYSAIDAYNEYIVLEEPWPLNPGDSVILTDGTVTENHVINEAISPDVYSTVTPISYHFPIGTRIVRVKYPDPIPLVSARMAAANIYDKYYVSEASPDTSNFGKYIREQARALLNNILNGRTILHGHHRVGGSRFWNPTLDAQYGLPKGTEGSKDSDQLAKG